MNAILNFFSRTFGPVTVGDAIADLDKAVLQLDKAIANHDEQCVRAIYAAEEASSVAQKHEYASVRATRIRAKLADLIG